MNIARGVRKVVGAQIKALDEGTPDLDGDPELPQSLAEVLRAWVIDRPDEARQLLEPDPLVPKTLEQLNDMVFHIRYEVIQLINFLRIGNEGVPNKFVAMSMLEAALIHIRCVYEFLSHTGRPEDTITAKEYVSKWHWTKGQDLSGDLKQVHGRLAHLGLIRCSVQRDDKDFSWEEFFTRDPVPILLDGFRDFLGQLDAHWVAQFIQPKPTEPRIDLVTEINDLIGPAGSR
jgi:hypothetical protein